MYIYIHVLICCCMYIVYHKLITCTVGLMSALWRNDKTVKHWKLRKACEVFGNKFDKIQDQLQCISCMDELLSGMLI